MALVAIQPDEGFPPPLLITPWESKSLVLFGFKPFFFIAAGIQKQEYASKENENGE
jgi:hypothetical protein